ncbi:MAG: MBL fold metallo-hydrolase [Cyclobacteriaceae bacterium]|nr:MBL fold metallo-hydrolase [Cyclobacteriaceae bacterium]
MWGFLFLLLLFAAVLYVVMYRSFGATPSGARLDRVRRSPNYDGKSFHYTEHTDVMLPGVSPFTLMREFFRKGVQKKPPVTLPSVKTDLKRLPSDGTSIVWFGHSSYLVKTPTLTVLVDPVLKGLASPVPIAGKPFPGADEYGVEDLPHIDVVLITHDHYDHLHYESVSKLAGTASKFVTSLGVGSHLEFWGVPAANIVELDWWQRQDVGKAAFTATPARHFSGRLFRRGQTLWSGFVLEADGLRLYLGGDSGYGPHFREIGLRFDGFDLALLECGQYSPYWPYIHMQPEETVQAAHDLGAKVLMPVHWAKFELSIHAWDEPIRRAMAKADATGMPTTTPMIGEVVTVNGHYPEKKWWEGVGR